MIFEKWSCLYRRLDENFRVKVIMIPFFNLYFGDLKKIRFIILVSIYKKCFSLREESG